MFSLPPLLKSAKVILFGRLKPIDIAGCLFLPFCIMLGKVCIKENTIWI
jgi:hypothetical protein